MAMKWRHHIELHHIASQIVVEAQVEGRTGYQLEGYLTRTMRESTYQPPNAKLANVTQNILALKLFVVTTCVMSWVAVYPPRAETR